MSKKLKQIQIQNKIGQIIQCVSDGVGENIYILRNYDGHWWQCRLVGIVCYNYKCTMWLEMKMKGPLLYVSVYLVGPQHNALCRKGQIMCLILIAFQEKMHKIYYTYIHSVHSLLNCNPCTQMQVLIYCILGIFHFFEPMQSYAFAV